MLATQRLSILVQASPTGKSQEDKEKVIKISFFLKRFSSAVQKFWSPVCKVCDLLGFLNRSFGSFWNLGRECATAEPVLQLLTEKDSLRKSPVASMGKCPRWPIYISYTTCVVISSILAFPPLPRAQGRWECWALDKLDKYTLYTLMFSHGTHCTTA